MQTNGNRNISGFIAGVAIGGVLGSSIAMLLTPMSGKKLRRKISNVTDDLIEDVNEYVETGREKAEELIKEGKKKASSIITDAKKLVNIS
ncbi:MAG: YtxH domain-containing protein [Ignavibacteriaceae bacterium]|nr:YtxH domain-containing protein [Ignavibacteriaceae bacterium]